jgi:dephospho-CoA kinase
MSSDDVVHGLYADPDVVRDVVNRFGKSVLDESGALDRARLGPQAFSQDGGIAFLEALFHPRVNRLRMKWIAQQDRRDPPPPLLVCEVPVLFEAGAEDEFDAVVVVTASEDVRRARVEARGQRFAERLARQIPEDEKVARADRSYVNDGSLDDLGRWVAECYATYAGRPCDG